jgi:Holliday junction resolvasome RuvABC DNA-binding subunit
MTNHMVCSHTLMSRSSATKPKPMIEEYNNNNKDSSSEANYKSKRTSQNKELSKVLEALESLGFRPVEYQEN